MADEADLDVLGTENEPALIDKSARRATGPRITVGEIQDLKRI